MTEVRGRHLLTSTISRKRSGFTIVELLVVIVVIAILASVTVVAYNNIQKQARDSKRKDDVAKIVKAFYMWSAETGGNFADMTAGNSGSEAGWFDHTYAPYPSIKSVVVDANYLVESVVDPINNKFNSTRDIHAYMVAPCNTSDNTNRRVILARLEIVPEQTVAQQLAPIACNSSTLTTYMTGIYNMNYAQLVELN